MASRRWKEYLQGYVQVEVRGKNPERLVNLCLSAGFPIWDVRTGDHSAFFSTSLARYKDIHRLARRARCVPHVVKRVGVPFTAAKIRKRPFFLLAAALVIAVLIYLSGSVWEIRVVGNEKVDASNILEAAYSAGLRPGARRSAIDPPKVESAISLANSGLSWVYVHFRGTLALIEVVEKTRPESPGPGDVVAAKDGVIQSILVLSGQPVVTVGETVKAGQLLIVGDEKGAIQGARGSVTAKTWYEAYREVPLEQTVAQRTGRKLEMTVVRYGGNEFALFGKSNAFEWYEVEDYPKWRIQKGGEIVTRVLFEVKWTKVRIAPEEAAALAEKQARLAIEGQLPSHAKLVDLKCEIASETENAVGVRAVASTVEEIGQVREWPKRETEVDR